MSEKNVSEKKKPPKQSTKTQKQATKTQKQQKKRPPKYLTKTKKHQKHHRVKGGKHFASTGQISGGYSFTKRGGQTTRRPVDPRYRRRIIEDNSYRYEIPEEEEVEENSDEEFQSDSEREWDTQAESPQMEGDTDVDKSVQGIQSLSIQERSKFEKESQIEIPKEEKPIEEKEELPKTEQLIQNTPENFEDETTQQELDIVDELLSLDKDFSNEEKLIVYKPIHKPRKYIPRKQKPRKHKPIVQKPIIHNPKPIIPKTEQLIQNTPIIPPKKHEKIDKTTKQELDFIDELLSLDKDNTETSPKKETNFEFKFVNQSTPNETKEDYEDVQKWLDELI